MKPCTIILIVLMLSLLFVAGCSPESSVYQSTIPQIEKNTETINNNLQNIVDNQQVISAKLDAIQKNQQTLVDNQVAMNENIKRACTK